MGVAAHLSDFYDQPPLTEKERRAQTKLIMRLFELWNLSLAEQSICLGLSPHTRSNIGKYKTGTAYLPLFRDTQDRVRLLLAIHERLRILFPRNKDIAYRWIQTPNRTFENFTPLFVIGRDGLAGLIAVKNYLDQVSAI